VSTYSEAWHATPRPVQDFYRNYQRRNLQHSWKAEYVDPPGLWIGFITFGWAFLGYTGFALAQANWREQTLRTGSFDPQKVLLTVSPDWPPPAIQPVGPGGNDGAYPDQFVEVPAMAFNYPREKYKVRRTRWTGKPMRRQNL